MNHDETADKTNLERECWFNEGDQNNHLALKSIAALHHRQLQIVRAVSVSFNYLTTSTKPSQIDVLTTNPKEKLRIKEIEIGHLSKFEHKKWCIVW